jgi:hypothetical protein
VRKGVSHAESAETAERIEEKLKARGSRLKEKDGRQKTEPRRQYAVSTTESAEKRQNQKEKGKG